MKAFAEMSEAEQNALYGAHEAGRTIELYNPNMGVWLVTYIPSFCGDMAYRIAEQQAEPIEDIKRG